MTWDKIAKGGAIIAGIVAGIFGEWTMLLTCLAVMMGIDYLTGVIVAWCGRSPKSDGGGVSSKAGFAGLLKKAFIMLIVLMATVLDKTLGMEAAVFQTATACYYIANEGLSVMENAALLGVPFPEKIKQALEALKAKEEKPPDDMAV